MTSGRAGRISLNRFVEITAEAAQIALKNGITTVRDSYGAFWAAAPAEASAIATALAAARRREGVEPGLGLVNRSHPQRMRSIQQNISGISNSER